VVDGVAALLEVLRDHLSDVAMILDEQQHRAGSLESAVSAQKRA
jgi:hypothetical protein